MAIDVGHLARNTLIGSLSVLAAVTVWRRAKIGKARSGLPLPPGPPGWPIIGNLFDLPNSYEWTAYRDWGASYGSDIISISSYGMHTVVVNTATAAHELFEKRSAIYSDRPTVTALSYLGIDEWNLGFLGYGPRWRIWRKLFQEQFKPEFLARFETRQKEVVLDLLRSLVSHPENFNASIRHFTGRTIMHIAYGMELQGRHDPYLAMVERAMSAINQALALGGVVLDLLPILKKMPSWFPGAGFKTYAARMRPDVGRVMMDKPWEALTDAKGQIIDEDKRASVAGQLFEKYGGDPTIQDEIKAVPAVMYFAGTDSSVSSLLAFFMAMVLYPEVQRKAQNELDDVLCGALPTLAMRAQLPYTNALVKEVFRWYPATPLGVSHATTADDVYGGMFIPAGSRVIGNIWAILHDSSLFPDPERFDPAHFLPSDAGGTYPVDVCKGGEPPFPEAAFGFGRRICAGRLLAKDNVWLAVASVLSMFHIEHAKDENGNDVPIVESWSSGLVGFPGPYQCAIMPRSAKASETIDMSTAVEGMLG